MSIQDSGHRTYFETGAVRDARPGVGRCDLLPLDVIGELTSSRPLEHINDFIRSGNPVKLYMAIYAFLNEKDWDIYTALLEVSKQYEEGCAKYGDRNWEKGIPLHCFIDSGVRHYLKWCRGDTDEPHDRAFLWNMLGCLWTLKHKPELNDLPFAISGDDND